MKLFKNAKQLKRYLPVLGVAALLCSVVLPLGNFRASADSTNLIANASLETASTTNAALPQSWSQDSWGTNTHTFSYLSTGHTGTKSAQVSITKYTSGDAKWYFTPVTVTGSTAYTFTDYYKATIASDVVAQLDDGTGNYTYQDLGTAAAATGWTQYSTNFTTPATTKSVTIFHLINAVGSLTIDDASMTTAAVTPPVTPPATGNVIANPSLETASTSNSALPQDWATDTWGTNTSTFKYLTTGHTGTKSAQVSITKYTSGDAKWYFTPVAVTGGSTYDFSDYYKSTVASDVVAQLDDGTGNYTYQDLGTPAAATDWAQYQTSFTVPATTKSVTIFHLIAAVGSLTIDDASMSATTGTTTPPPVTPAGTVIANPSLETASTTNSAMPDSWLQDSWGTNTHTFSYLNTGHTGTKSAQVSITKYTSGDAKWYFTPLSVTPNTSYTFTDYYKSTIASDVVAQLDDGTGNYTYVDLGTAATATAWKQYSGSFVTAANTKSVTIFHLINAVGSLTIDDAAMNPTNTGTTPPPATSPTPYAPPVNSPNNLTPNPSVETVAPNDTTSPAQWYKGYYGNNTATFSYPTTGHTGSRSAKITMSNFVDGGANWTYDSVPVTGGKSYTFSDFYQSNVATQALVAVKMSDGTTQYLWLGNPYASDGTWTRFYKEFTMPTGAVSAVVYQSISANGYLTVDDVVLQTTVPSPLANPLVSVTFDDSLQSQYLNGLPILQKYGLNGTFYAISGDLNTCDGPLCYMTNQQVKDIYAAGNEIGSHTVDHPDLTLATPTQLTSELSQSQASLQQLIGAPITDFAAPYGSVNLNVLNASQQYYTSQRGVQLGYNDLYDYDQQNLLVQDINSTTTVAQVQSYIDYAKATNTWLILMYHDIDADNTVDPGYNTTPADFDTAMAYLKASGITVQTMTQALATVAPQLTK